MLVTDLFGNESTTHVARPSTACTSHFVAPVRLDKFFPTARFRTRSNLGVGNGFFNLETSLGFVLLFNFGALERNMGGFAAEFTRLLSAFGNGALKDHLLGWNFCLDATLWT